MEQKKHEEQLLDAMMEAPDEEGKPCIPEFYKGKTILITGGTGFMGKVLIEKLLWSCPDLKTIYILLRPKKGKASHERLIDIENSLLFERLRTRDSKVFYEKVKVINGDITQLGLGLSPEDRQILINEVSIIFHAAASVRFDDPLKEAVLLNTRGSRELMMLAKEIKNLEILLHTSTTYCNTDKNPVYEKLYPPHGDWKDIIEIAEKMDETHLKILTPKLLTTLPNTYVFSKSLAEHVVNDLRGDLPCIIFRPSIVVSSLSEPMPGWIENFNGPVGLLVACGKGIMRSMCSVSNIRADYMAVDIAIKGMIVAAWKHGTEKVKKENPIPVYNCSSSLVTDVTFNDIINIGMNMVKTVPFNDVVWVPGGGFTELKIIHFIKIVLFHLLPALVLDTLLRFLGKKPILVKVQRKIYIASQALNYYITNEWLFKNNRFMELKKQILPQDIEAFRYDFEDIDVFDFLQGCIIGARRYLLNEPDDTLPQAKAHYNRMYILDLIVKTIFWALVIYAMYKSAFIRSALNEAYYVIGGTGIN